VVIIMSASGTDSSTVKVIAPGLSVERIVDGRIIVFTVRDVSRHLVDLWMQELESILSTWPADQPYYSLYDVNFPGGTLTPYVRTRVAEILKKYENLTGTTAIILPGSLLATVFQLLLRATAWSKRKRRIFNRLEPGLKWLKESLEESKR
jgi:hypothetical protein